MGMGTGIDTSQDLLKDSGSIVRLKKPAGGITDKDAVEPIKRLDAGLSTVVMRSSSRNFSAGNSRKQFSDILLEIITVDSITCIDFIPFIIFNSVIIH